MRQKPFTIEFVEEAVHLVRTGGRTKADIAADLGVSPSTLTRWVARQHTKQNDAARRRSADKIGCFTIGNGRPATPTVPAWIRNRCGEYKVQFSIIDDNENESDYRIDFDSSPENALDLAFELLVVGAAAQAAKQDPYDDTDCGDYFHTSQTRAALNVLRAWVKQLRG